MIVQTDFDIKELNITETLTVSDYPFSLVVWNDEVNTFDWVIESLIEICQHTLDQAEQCAMLIHFKGKYAVKNGEFDTLKTMCEAIGERGINATIEEVAHK
ncbi:MAG: ATP-dependent Clp protease adaptor ClpS [Chitinophagaceae bacterium]